MFLLISFFFLTLLYNFLFPYFYFFYTISNFCNRLLNTNTCYVSTLIFSHSRSL